MVVSIRTRPQGTQTEKTPCLSSAPGRRRTIVGCVFLVFLICLTTSASAARSQSYTFGVFPYHNGLDPERGVTLKHVPSHNACLHQLLVGTAQACVTASTPWRIFQQQHQVRFRQLARTPSIPSSLFVAHARMGAHDRAQLQRALVTWHQSEPGQTLLARAHFSRLVPASDATYAVVQTYWKGIMETCSRDCP